MDLARFRDVPLVSGKQNRAPDVAVYVHDLPQRGGEYLRVREGLLDLGDHFLEAVDLGREILAARFRSLHPEGKLEVLLIAD